MSKPFRARVNGKFEFSISENDLGSLDIYPGTDANYHILQNHRSIRAVLEASDLLKKSYQISIGGNRYEVVLSDDLDLFIEDLGFTGGKEEAVRELMAPMPGMVLEMHVEAGQEVNTDDPLLVLEAMKMENIILSPRDGVISEVKVVQGAAVEKGVVLITFE